ncbi:MAG: hypothetical protein WC695_10340 [Candidatus Omnitrophota bacterium]
MRKSAVFMVFLVLILTGCAQEEKPAITIGNILVSAKEFDDAFKASGFASGGQGRKKEFLEFFISRKLILKEAEGLGLDKDPQFLRSVQLFWEQSLLKLALSRKINELAVAARVDDTLIKNYYDQNKEKEFSGKELPEVYDQIKWFLFKLQEKKALQSWTESLHKKNAIAVDHALLGLEKNK